MSQVQFNFDIATCKAIAKGIWDRYTKGSRNQLEKNDFASMITEAYRAINKSFYPTEEDIKGYERVCDRDNDGIVNYNDLERAIIETLGAKQEEIIESFQAEQPQERTKKAAVKSIPIPKEEDPLLALAKRLFAKYDSDGSGELESHEVPAILEETWKVMGLNKKASQHEVESYLKMVDEDKDGKISFNEFFEIIKKTCGGLANIQRQASSGGMTPGGTTPGTRTMRDIIRDSFKKFDTDNSGFIEDSEVLALLRDLYNTLGMKRQITEDDAQYYIKKLDANGDGKISCEEFEGLFLKETKG